MERKGFIGGSDCVKIMQGNWLELWQVKTGRVEPEDLSNVVAVQMGIHTESFNLEWFSQEYRCILSMHQQEFKEDIGSVPVKGTVDALKVNDDGSLSVVEAKHTYAMNSMDNVIEYYMPQIQLYAKLSKSDGIFLSVFLGNNRWESVYVSFNKEYFDSMWAVVSDFWGYVLSDREPVGIETPHVSTHKIAVDEMVVSDRTKDNQFVSAAHDYCEHEQSAKAFESAKKDLKSMVGADEREAFCETLTIKRSKNGALRFTRRDKK